MRAWREKKLAESKFGVETRACVPDKKKKYIKNRGWKRVNERDTESKFELVRLRVPVRDKDTYIVEQCKSQ